MDIKKIREKLGMTQEQFCTSLNGVELNIMIRDVRRIDRTQISGWEIGRRNPDKLIKKAIKILQENKKCLTKK